MTVNQHHFKPNNIYYFLFLDEFLSSDDDDIAPLTLQQINKPNIGKVKSLLMSILIYFYF